MTSKEEIESKQDLSFKHVNLYDIEGYTFKSKLCNEYEKIVNYYPSRRSIQEYQKIASNYFQPLSKYKSLLCYLGTGLGKTVIALNIINNLKLIHDKLNVIIMCPASLKDATWRPSVDSWIYDKRVKSNIYYISLDSPTFATEFDLTTKSLSFNAQVLFIIDECHIFTSSLVDETSNRRIVYNQLLNSIKNHNAYVVCLTATPIVNRVEELIYLFNILRPDTFHSKESLFLDMFTNSLNGSLKNKHIFCKRITGMVSYFESIKKKDLPDITEHVMRMEMSQIQRATYAYAEKEETKRLSNYKQGTISICNFAPPIELYKHGYDMRSLIMGADAIQLKEMSPKFAHIIEQIENSKRLNVVHSSYVESTIVPFEIYLERAGYKRYTLRFANKKKRQNVEMIGNGDVDKDMMSSSKIYATVTGRTSANERAEILSVNNSKDNMYGRYIKVLVISDAFSMGVTLKYAENIFLLNYHWNLMKKFQAFGRIARLTTHIDLPPEERFVNQYIYVSTRANSGENIVRALATTTTDTDKTQSIAITTDELLEKTAMQKDQKMSMFLDLIKISSIDFEYNKKNPEFLYREREPFRASLYELETRKPYMTRSIMDEEGIFKNNVLELEIRKINTRQINVSYVDSRNNKQSRKVLLVYPILNYYIVDINYYNYIGYLIQENGRPVFDRETNYFAAIVFL
jgi:superfamily II DNA or RNA helicase